uniref:GP-PDE domain-containing protein n=1 Tax=Panagrellus redivivus TaxID=6233 RepID=A0A7E4VA64_PANRE
MSDEDETAVTFAVRVADIHAWEFVFVVGDHVQLGNWNPDQALELVYSEKDNVWMNRLTLTVEQARHPLRYRYFIGYYLQASSDATSKVRVISRWESQFLPRHFMCAIDKYLGGTDEFGHYNGKNKVSAGWLHQPKQCQIYLRLHGASLKFFKERYSQRPYFIKIVSFDLRRKEIGTSLDDDPDDSLDGSGIPPLPSFSHTEVSDHYAENPHFHAQTAHGREFQNENSYVVFRTTSVAVDYLAFRIEFYVDHSRTTKKDVEPSIDLQPRTHRDAPDRLRSSKSSSGHLQKTGIERIAIAYCMPTGMSDTFGQISVPILAKNQQPIGMVNIDYLIVRSMQNPVPMSMEVSFARHWKKRAPLEVGHRGMGNSYTKFSAVRENTLDSLNKAARNGADFVEFDVQLTKDQKVVIFHDFHVLVSVARRTMRDTRLPKADSVEFHELALKDLKLKQLQLLHLDHHKAPENQDKLKVTGALTETEENHPFPTLIEALKHVDGDTGFNIEIKYPMKMKDGSHECENYFERNLFIDTILEDVFKFAGNRRIVFSSFDPDVCTMIAMKQPRYPVLFLSVGVTTRYVPFLDQRSCTSEMAVNYATSQNILGVNFHSEDLLRDPSHVRKARERGLVSFVWGDDLDDPNNIQAMRNLNLDGIIYDRIGADQARRNVFTVERTAKASLFGSSPAPSRSGSLDRSTSRLSNHDSIPLALSQLDLAGSTPSPTTSTHNGTTTSTPSTVPVVFVQKDKEDSSSSSD